MKYLSFDIGLSRTGVAVSHEGQLVELLPSISTPTDEFLLTKVKNQIKAQQPDLVVLGQPNRGSINELSMWLAQELQKDGHQVQLFPEDSSSKMADTQLFQAKLTVKKRIEKQHSAAAAVILQAYLDSL